MTAYEIHPAIDIAQLGSSRPMSEKGYRLTRKQPRAVLEPRTGRNGSIERLQRMDNVELHSAAERIDRKVQIEEQSVSLALENGADGPFVPVRANGVAADLGHLFFCDGRGLGPGRARSRYIGKPEMRHGLH
jgi:hypothetical protein